MMKEISKEYVQKQLSMRFQELALTVISIEKNISGTFKVRRSLIEKLLFGAGIISGLPEYIDVRIEIRTGDFKEKIIVWCPVQWNGRFAGTAGGGISTGGESYLTAPDEYTRGWTVPYAVMKGYTAATGDAMNCKGRRDFTLDKKTGVLQKDLYENWNHRTTHHMTIIGKAVAEIIHERPVEFSYMNGGSGGGRQSLAEVQLYPNDYDGVWASCPAINWNRFLMMGFWTVAVMNSYHHELTPAKMKYFTEAVRSACGGDEVYFTSTKKPQFDPYSVVGAMTKTGEITKEDARVADTIWNGAVDKDGNRLWYFIRPGVKCWNIGVPIGTFYYTLFRKKPRTMFLADSYLRWVTGNPEEKFQDITMAEFEKMFQQSVEKFPDAAFDNVDLSEFAAHGGKLLIDHGLNDPLIPVDGTINYYSRMVDFLGKEKVDDFCRLYIVPGDGHGNCWSEQPGITEGAGIDALVDWVEHGIAPKGLYGVKVDRKSRKIWKEKTINPVTDIRDWM